MCKICEVNFKKGKIRKTWEYLGDVEPNEWKEQREKEGEKGKEAGCLERRAEDQRNRKWHLSPFWGSSVNKGGRKRHKAEEGGRVRGNEREGFVVNPKTFMKHKTEDKQTSYPPEWSLRVKTAGGTTTNKSRQWQSVNEEGPLEGVFKFVRWMLRQS